MILLLSSSLALASRRTSISRIELLSEANQVLLPSFGSVVSSNLSLISGGR